MSDSSPKANMVEAETASTEDEAKPDSDVTQIAMPAEEEKKKDTVPRVTTAPTVANGSKLEYSYGVLAFDVNDDQDENNDDMAELHLLSYFKDEY